MRKLISAFLIFSFCLGNFSFICTNEVPLKGQWGEDLGPRSLPPVKPIASVDGDLLLICFPNILQNVLVTVENASGGEIYSSRIATPYSGYVLQIPLTGHSGEFVVTISHYYGTLIGVFDIE